MDTAKCIDGSIININLANFRPTCIQTDDGYNTYISEDGSLFRQSMGEDFGENMFYLSSEIPQDLELFKTCRVEEPSKYNFYTKHN